MVFSLPPSDEELMQAVEAYRITGNQVLAAEHLGMPRGTLQGRLRSAALKGMMLDTKAAMPGFRVSRVSDGPNGKSIEQKPEHGGTFAIPKGHVVKGVSALLNAEGEKIVEWIKTKEGERDPLDIAEALKSAFVGYKPAAKPAKAPATAAADLLTLLPCNDWHINMSAWGKQVGTSWDLKIAEPTIGKAVVDTIERSPSSAECILLGGGDLMHINGKANTTANGTPQDTDSRYQKGVEVLGRLMVKTADAALRRHQHVTVRILKGNHDEDSSIAIAYFLLAWYRNEPRITVDVDPSDYFWFRFGQVMLGATHGHQTSNHIAKMPGIMAHRRATDWGASKFRYVHGFHLHHSAKIATEGNGVVCEVHQAPIPQDAWHFGSGFLSGRSLQAITYHKDFGEVGRVRTAILDAAEVV